MKNCLRKVFYLLYPMHSIRNALQYLIGGTLFYTMVGKISALKFLLGLVSFLLCYSFVYTINDIIDYKKDVRDSRTKERKLIHKSPLISKVLSLEELLTFSLTIFLIGLLIASSINSFFLVMMVVLILLNVIHSNTKPFLWILVPNMILMQFIKFSSGWFTQTLEASSLPFWFLMCCSGVYVSMYLFFIKRSMLTRLHKKILIYGMGIFLILSLTFSIFLYRILFPILIATVVGILFFILLRKVRQFGKMMRIGLLMQYSIEIILILSLILVRGVPSMWVANEKISMKLEKTQWAEKIKDLNEYLVSNFTSKIPKIMEW